MSSDYIVVGAGSAGCVVANRLSQNRSTTVLLLEAGGPDVKPEIAIPHVYSNLQGTEIDWCYQTEQEPYLKNRQIMINHGKVLGGSSSINAMMYVRGNRADYDHWQSLGNNGWSYQDVLPCFKRLEDTLLGPSEFHGVGGPITITTLKEPHALSLGFIAAGLELGYPLNPDFNGAEQLGVGIFQTNIKEGLRHSAAAAFLHPILQRANLRIETDALVSRILFEGNRAIGVAYIKQGVEHVEYANKEVVLCAGALSTPKLLMLSGVGPAEMLSSLHLPVIADLPGVGQNLQDHIFVGVAFKSSLSLSGLKSNGCEVGMFIRFDGSTDVGADLQINAVLDMNLDPADMSSAVLTICPTLLHPKSRGVVSLCSADVTALPRIQANYLQHEDDMVALLKGVELARELANAKAFQGMLGKEFIPGSLLSNHEALKKFIRDTATTLWHPVGTCRMGVDKLAVVDPQTKVMGVENLRVADASIMPTISSGNTNATCLMIGEKCAELMLG